MDEGDEYDFSKSLVNNYFEQAESTFDKMDKALASGNLQDLSTLGHFLKGSSAAIGVVKVRNSCEAMQHYGTCRDADGITELSRDGAVHKLTETLGCVKLQYKEAESTLRSFFGE
ncbi:hypothetical protein MVES_001767 [Malassezia vespertilionis]|uniref:HPt domain-containing protein n=2 Tax=Malassezia vespertilionis TaxID=2020962 RepID=A0A2N1JDJ0_9BASI|nr:hypothetical protein MVES_001767 [Malassezia vespertilionis]